MGQTVWLVTTEARRHVIEDGAKVKNLVTPEAAFQMGFQRSRVK